ncbi:MAG: GAF domain-containing protein, partial [Anaerolineales bacterium]
APRLTVLVVSADAERREWLADALRKLDNAVVVSLDPHEYAADTLTQPAGLIIMDAAVAHGERSGFWERMRESESLAGAPLLTVAWPDLIAPSETFLAMGAVEHLVFTAGADSLRTRVSRWMEYQQLRTVAEGYRLQLQAEQRRSDELLHVVIPIGMALSAEKDFDRLLEMILLEAKQFCNADGGTLYLRTHDDELKFVIMRNDSLQIALGGTTGRAVEFPAIPLYLPGTRRPNEHNVASYAALRGHSVNITDAYTEAGFDFSGTRAFDERTGYRSTSFLTIPLKNTHDYVIGVLQLLNAIEPTSGAVVPFEPAVQRMVEILAALATIALEAYIREQKLRETIQKLSIEIDEIRKERQVAEITESEYFKQLRERARAIRRKSSGVGSRSAPAAEGDES